MIVTDKLELSKVSADVCFGVDISQTIELMKMEMLKHKGVGIAAIQVGVAIRVIIINTDRCQSVFINPELSNGKFEKESKEGCLSVPNKQAKIKRFNRITISGYDESWNKFSMNLKALSAFVAQHEVDHLNGITI